MSLLSLAEEIGLEPNRCASTDGGEYKSACPNCKSGDDRFCIWPDKKSNGEISGRYWCRICKCYGDSIQFCREFLGQSYLDACKKLKTEPRFEKGIPRGHNPFKKQTFKPQAISTVSGTWQNRARQFLDYSHNQLLESNDAMKILSERGIELLTIKSFRLGWNPQTLYDIRTSWGLPFELNEKNHERKQWLPKGIIIPAYENGALVRIKIRRSDWNANDKLPKYVEVSGSFKRLPVYGDIIKPIIVMESELDAILVQQFSSDLCCCVALGGVGKKPDEQLHQFLKSAPLILLALDYDEAGRKEYPFWMSLYPNLRPWPARKGKSPGDSYKLHQVDLRKWVVDGISFF